MAARWRFAEADLESRALVARAPAPPLADARGFAGLIGSRVRWSRALPLLSPDMAPST